MNRRSSKDPRPSSLDPRPVTRLALLPWSVAGAMALVAPWLLGGRAAAAHPVLGTMAWAAAMLCLVCVGAQYGQYRPFADYEARRGRGAAHPLKQFLKGLAWTLPLWGLIGLMILSAFNPAYRWEGSGAEAQLALQDFNPALPLVIDPERSRPGIYFATGLLALMALLANPLLRPRRPWIHGILAAMLVNAVILAWTGLYFRFTGAELLLGHFEPRAGYFFATFFYKNHWAAFAVLHCTIAAAFFFRDLPRWQENSRQAGSGGLALVALFFIALTLPVVDSRGGILLFAVFMVVFLGVLYGRLHSRRGRGVLAVLALAGLAGFTVLSVQDLQRNWQRTESQVERAESIVFDHIRAVHAPEVCLDMLAARPLWGWGYLSYDPLFPVYATDYFRDAEGNLRSDMEFAHNDWLQHLAELGWAGSVLFVLGLVLNPGWRAGPRGPRGSRLSPWLLLGLALLGLHATWDFPLSNPAVMSCACFCLFTIRIRN